MLLLLPTLLALWAPQLQAATPSGLGLPSYGGGLSGPAQDGTLGLVLNPAAAHPDRAETLVDAGFIRYHYGHDLETWDAVPGKSWDLLPYLAAAVPVGPVGLGLAAGLPYARSGSSEAVGPQRFHTVSGRILVWEADLALAWQPLPELTLGGALRGGYTRYYSSVAVDTGAMINGVLGPDAGAPVGEPLLEGTRSVELATGGAWGFSVGARFQTQAGLALAAGYRSALHTQVTGQLVLVPSNDLSMALEGDLTGKLDLPPEAFLAATLPAGPAEIDLETGWVGWGSMAVTHQQVDNLVIVSDDPVVTALLESYGLDDPALLGSLESEGMAGLHDIFTAGLAVRMPVAERWGLLAGARYSPAAISDEFVAPGNFDYDSLDVRIVTSFSPVPRSKLALCADLISYRNRVITDSIYAWDNDPEVAPALPPSEGAYWMRMWRVGFSWQQTY